MHATNEFENQSHLELAVKKSGKSKKMSFLAVVAD
jgi:hypothetical protein